MSIRKGILAVLLIASLLAMLLPSPALAQPGGGWDGTLVVVLILAVAIIAYGIYAVMEWDNFYEIDPGDIFLNARSDSLSMTSLSTARLSQADFSHTMQYDIDWLLTDRIEGRAWVGSGITIESMMDSCGIMETDFRYGNNLILGYRKGFLDQKLSLLYFPDGEFRANLNMIYRF